MLTYRIPPEFIDHGVAAPWRQGKLNKSVRLSHGTFRVQCPNRYVRCVPCLSAPSSVLWPYDPRNLPNRHSNGQHFQKSMDQPGMVVNPTRGQLNRAENEFSLYPFMPENLISRDRLGRLVPR